MNAAIKEIVIVGGGTAGWLTAAVLGAQFKLNQQFSITLIESPNIKTIGVGEGTWPSMAATLRRIGIPEAQFISECDASFKQGSKFKGWKQGKDEQYYHPFSLPVGYSELNIVDHWLDSDMAQSFGEFASNQIPICEQHLAPKQANTPDYASVVNYGYHLDAGKFAQLLKKHCLKNLGIKYISDDVLSVTSTDDNIDSVSTDNHGLISGDLFIDCTGFKALLIGEHLGVPMVELNDVLFNDRALAIQVPHENEQGPISSTTHATAHSFGWIWDIALPTRRGIGLVYSSRHGSKEQALENLQAYLKTAAPHVNVDEIVPRELSFNPGHRELHWKGNCIAIGLSAGFIDPLEATAMALIELSARFLSEHLPATKSQLPYLAEQFNKRFTHHWDNIVDFIKLHYVLSDREDSDYWLDHRSPTSTPSRLKSRLEIWQQRAPWHADVELAEQMFPPASYQYILCGMGFKPNNNLNLRRSADNEKQLLKQLQFQKQQQIQKLHKHLPSNRQLLETIRHNWRLNEA
jgi:tryptophan halogenase